MLLLLLYCLYLFFYFLFFRIAIPVRSWSGHSADIGYGVSKTASATRRTGHFSKQETRVCGQNPTVGLTDHTPFFVFGLSTASDRLLLNVHQVAVHARSPCARRHHTVRLPDVLHLFVFQGLSLQHVAVLHGNLPVEVGAHLVR